MSLYRNDEGGVGYQACVIEGSDPDTAIQYVQEDAPQYVVEHEFRRSPGESLQVLMDEVLEE